MKGDRMPTILSPIALAIGEDYTDRWLDYLLDPLKLKDHLKELKNQTSNHPNEASIIKTLMKQYEKGYKSSNNTSTTTTISSPPPPQQQSVALSSSSSLTTPSSTPPSTTSTSATPSTTSTSTTSSTTSLSTITAQRLKTLVNLVIIVIIDSNLSLNHLSKIVQAFKHQRLLVEELESSQPNDSVFHTYLKRWIIRGIIKGDPIKYLINSSHTLFSKTMVLGGSSSPPLPSTTGGISLQQSLGLAGLTSGGGQSSASSTPPSSPPPTPPQYINIQQSSKERDSPTTISQKESEMLILEQITKDALDFLIEWIEHHRKNKDLQSAIAEITLELGEYYFYKQDYQVAKDYFNQSLNYGIFNGMDRAKSFLIACKSMMMVNQDTMMIDNEEKKDESKPTASWLEMIEIAVVHNQQDKILECLYQDIIDSTLNWQFRKNLERNQLISFDNRINIYILNLIKSIIYLDSFNDKYDSISLDQFKEKNFEFLFNTVHKLTLEMEDKLKNHCQENNNENRSFYKERLSFHLNRIGFILNNDLYWNQFKLILPTLIEKANGIENGNNDQKDEIMNEGGETKSKLEIYGEILNQDDKVKIDELLKLFSEEEKEKEKHIIDQMLVDNRIRQILRNQQQDEHQNDNTINIQHKITLEEQSYFEMIQSMKEFYRSSEQKEINQEREKEIVIDSLQGLTNRSYSPTYEIILIIISTLINHSRWSIIPTCCDILSNQLQQQLQRQSQQQKQIITPTILRLTNSLFQISKSLSTISSNLISINLYPKSSLVPTKSSGSDSMDLDKKSIINQIIENTITFIKMLSNENGCSKHWVLDSVGSSSNSGSFTETSSINLLSVGLLNYLKNESLLESLLSIFIGLLAVLSRSSPKDQRTSASVVAISDDLHLEYYGEITTVISQHPPQQLTNLLFQQITTNIDQLEAVVREIILNTALRLNRSVDKVSFKSIYILGDLYFEKNKYMESIRYYLMSFALQSSFFTNNRKVIDQLPDISRIVPKLSTCLLQLGYPMQAVAINQLLLSLPQSQQQQPSSQQQQQQQPLSQQQQTYSLCFKIIPDHINQLDSLYFQYIFEIPILELLIHHYNKLKDIKKLTLLNQIISSPIMNEFNHPDIRSNFQKTTKINLLKSLATDFLLN